MKYIYMSLCSVSLLACSHGPTVADHGSSQAPVVFSFKAVDKGARTVTAEPSPVIAHEASAKPQVSWATKPEIKPVEKALPKQSDKKSAKHKKGEVAAEKKFIAVTPCPQGQECKTGEKLVPYEKFVNNIREKIKRSGDVVDKQEHFLAQDLEKLKLEKENMLRDQAYFNEQIRLYRYSSLKPVMDGYKRASAGIDKDIKMFDSKIIKFEQDLNLLRNVKSIRVTGDAPTEKIMQLVDAGQLSVGDELSPEHRVLWNFLQSVGAEVAAN